MNFGTKLRIRRQELQLTQAELGKLLGVYRGTIISWEKSQTMPKDAFMLSKIEAVLGIDISEALNEDSVVADYIAAAQKKPNQIDEAVDFAKLREDLVHQTRFQLKSWRAVLAMLEKTDVLSVQLRREVRETQEEITAILRRRKQKQRRTEKVQRRRKAQDRKRTEQRL